MESECERLDKARHRVVTGGFGKANMEALFPAAHDIKGEAATFGFPAVTDAAENSPGSVAPSSRNRSSSGP